MKADLEGPVNDVTLSVTTDKSSSLDSVILHPCVQMHGATVSTSGEHAFSYQNGIKIHNIK